MPMTVNSSFSPYCTPANFVTLVDWRPMGQYCVDNDVPPANQAAFLASPILLAKLQVAAGDIEMAATRGARYDPLDLTTLVTPVNGVISNGGWALIEMNAGIAAYRIAGRRIEGLPKYLQELIQDSQAKLGALEAGEEIFPFADAQQAGLVSDYQETSVDVTKRNMPSNVARPLFGCRDNVLPYGG